MIFLFTLVKYLHLYPVITTNNEIMCILDGELDFDQQIFVFLKKKAVPEVVCYHDMLTCFVPLCLLSSRGFEYVLFRCFLLVFFAVSLQIIKFLDVVNKFRVLSGLAGKEGGRGSPVSCREQN